MTGKPSDELRELYERRAELHYDRPGFGLPPERDRKFEGVWSLVASSLPVRRFLDAGCGDGRHLAAFTGVAERPELVGSDISERVLETARATIAAVGVVAELRPANLEQLPFEDESFDLVLCTQVIEHLLDPAAGMAELVRVLEPGGRLIITTDNRRTISRVLNGPRDSVVRGLRLAGRRSGVAFPHRDYSIPEFEALVDAASLERERRATFRIHLRAPLNRGVVQALLDRVDRVLPPHRFGDVVAIVARKPA